MRPLEKINVLLVEDEYINAWALANALKAHCNIRHAGTKEEALYWIHRESYELVLLDIHLGHQKQAGIDLLPQIKSIQPHCRIFATTGYGSEGDEARFLSLGFDAYFPKPVDEDRLISDLQVFGFRNKVA